MFRGKDWQLCCQGFIEKWIKVQLLQTGMKILIGVLAHCTLDSTIYKAFNILTQQLGSFTSRASSRAPAAAKPPQPRTGNFQQTITPDQEAFLAMPWATDSFPLQINTLSHKETQIARFLLYLNIWHNLHDTRWLDDTSGSLWGLTLMSAPSPVRSTVSHCCTLFLLSCF